MSRIPAVIARRVDRLSRRAHAFHRAAHHPLCQAYQPEVLRLGRRTVVCRGCAHAAAGAVAGALAGLAMPPPPALPLAAALFAGVVFLAVARRGVGPRRPKLLTRAAPAALGAATAACGLATGSLEGVVVAAAVVAAALLAGGAYRRRGPDRTPCIACPELSGSRTCSGFRPLVRRERAFRRLAGRWIQEAARP